MAISLVKLSPLAVSKNNMSSKSLMPLKEFWLLSH